MKTAMDVINKMNIKKRRFAIIYDLSPSDVL